MVALRKLLLTLLVLCTLGYSSAWAFDGHALEADNTLSDASISVTPDKHDAEHASTDSACDHCGHISAHLQAIFTQNGYLCSLNQSSDSLEYFEHFTSLISSPDLRPPRV